MVLEKTHESPLDCKEIKLINPEGNQPLIWIFIGRTDAQVEDPVLWPPDEKNQLIRKDPDAGKDWDRRRRGWQRKERLYSITDSMDMSLNKLWEMVKDRKTWPVAVHGVEKSHTELSDWTTRMMSLFQYAFYWSMFQLNKFIYWILQLFVFFVLKVSFYAFVRSSSLINSLWLY